METKAPDFGLYAVWDDEVKGLFVALSQHRRYLKEILEEEDDHPHNGLLVRELEVMDRLVDRFAETMEELQEEKRI
ncbi:MAG: hypothetical protein ACR2NI_06785 [Pirellulales bacterium]